MKKLTEHQIAHIGKKIELLNKQFIVLIDVMDEKQISQEECNRNIYCVDENNSIIWQIEFKPTGFDEDPYVYIGWFQNSLVAKNYSGFKYRINLFDGAVEKIGWDK